MGWVVFADEAVFRVRPVPTAHRAVACGRHITVQYIQCSTAQHSTAHAPGVGRPLGLSGPVKKG